MKFIYDCSKFLSPNSKDPITNMVIVVDMPSMVPDTKDLLSCSSPHQEGVVSRIVNTTVGGNISEEEAAAFIGSSFFNGSRRCTFKVSDCDGATEVLLCLKRDSEKHECKKPKGAYFFESTSPPLCGLIMPIDYVCEQCFPDFPKQTVLDAIRSKP